MIGYHCLRPTCPPSVAVIASPGGARNACGQGGDRDDPNRLRRPRDPVSWSRRQPCPAGRQRDRHQFFRR